MAARWQNGEIRYAPAVELGADGVTARRAEMVGDAEAKSPRAGYALGVLQITGNLSDRDLRGAAALSQAAARHNAGMRYAADHATVFGPRGPKSNFSAILDGARVLASVANQTESDAYLDAYDRWRGAIRAIGSLCPNWPRSLSALTEVAIDDNIVTDQAALSYLRQALKALVIFSDAERAING